MTFIGTVIFSQADRMSTIHKHWSKLHILDICAKARPHSIIRHICIIHSFLLTYNPVFFPLGKIHLFLLPHLIGSSKIQALEIFPWNISDNLMSRHINPRTALLGRYQEVPWVVASPALCFFLPRDALSGAIPTLSRHLSSASAVPYVRGTHNI